MQNYERLSLQPNVKQPDWLKGLDHLMLGYEHPEPEKIVGLVVYANARVPNQFGRGVDFALVLWYVPTGGNIRISPVVAEDGKKWIESQGNLNYNVYPSQFEGSIEYNRDSILRYCAHREAPADAVVFTETLKKSEDINKLIAVGSELTSIYLRRRNIGALVAQMGEPITYEDVKKIGEVLRESDTLNQFLIGLKEP